MMVFTTLIASSLITATLHWNHLNQNLSIHQQLLFCWCRKHILKLQCDKKLSSLSFSPLILLRPSSHICSPSSLIFSVNFQIFFLFHYHPGYHHCVIFNIKLTWYPMLHSLIARILEWSLASMKSSISRSKVWFLIVFYGKVWWYVCW